jgi:chromosome segregation ATPase
LLECSAIDIIFSLTKIILSMKKIILNSLLAVLVLGGAPVAYARDGVMHMDMPASSTEGKPQPIKAAVQAKREAGQEKIQDIKQKMASTTEVKKDLKQKLASTTEDKRELRQKIASTTAEKRDERKELIKTRIENKFGKMFARYQATIDREREIASKITARIEKIKANGGTTTEAEKFVAEAKTYLDEAQKQLDTLKTTAMNDSQIASSTTTSIAKETLSAMKKANQDLEKNLRSAHQSLQKSVGSLKGMSQLKNASSTREQNS